MYKIIFYNHKWNGKCAKYGFKHYIKNEVFRMLQNPETYEITWVLKLSKDKNNFKKCWEKYYDVLEIFPNIY